MARSSAESVDAYLSEMPQDRREVIAAIRALVLANLPDGYVETMNWGMISYEVPLTRHPKTYNKKPLSYAALAVQKGHCALYLNCVSADPRREARLRDEFAKSGKKLDMGKSCVRFRTTEDLDLEAIARVIASMSVDEFIAMYESSRPS